MSCETLPVRQVSALLAAATLVLSMGLSACGGNGNDVALKSDAARANSLAEAVAQNPGYLPETITEDYSFVPPKGINSLNQVTFYDTGFQAYIWTSPGGTVSISAPDLSFAAPVAMNLSGQVVGYAGNTDDGGTYAFSWTSGGGLVNIDSPGTVTNKISSSNSVNDAGQVVGIAQDASFNDRAFLWTQTGGLIDLGTLKGYASSGAMDINASGQIVGAAYNVDPNTGQASYRAVLWDAPKTARSAGRISDFLGKSHFGNSKAYSINASGEIAGIVEAATGGYQAFHWDKKKTKLTIIGTPGIVFENADMTVSINATGQVIGNYMDTSGLTHAFSWSQAGGKKEIGGVSSLSYAINSSGQVVGTYADESGMPRAFVWSSAGGLVDLSGASGIELESALAISDAGAIVARSGLGSLVLLKPV